VPMTKGDAVLTITAGVGITLTADPHHDPEALIFEAETAMHAAKRGGPAVTNSSSPRWVPSCSLAWTTQTPFAKPLPRGSSASSTSRRSRC